jgi:RNA polymerase sigma factor (sigma-70 family)
VVQPGHPEAFIDVSKSLTVPVTSGFEAFAADAEPRLRRALCSTYGPRVGREAALDALAYAWENWAKVGAMSNPVSYLYRVGCTAAKRAVRQLPSSNYVASVDRELVIEPKLDDALRRLSPQQRTVVVLVHGYGYSLQEVADTLGLKRTSIQNHADRAIARLRSIIGEVTS